MPTKGKGGQQELQSKKAIFPPPLVPEDDCFPDIIPHSPPLPSSSSVSFEHDGDSLSPLTAFPPGVEVATNSSEKRVESLLFFSSEPESEEENVLDIQSQMLYGKSGNTATTSSPLREIIASPPPQEKGNRKHNTPKPKKRSLTPKPRGTSPLSRRSTTKPIPTTNPPPPKKFISDISSPPSTTIADLYSTSDRDALISSPPGIPIKNSSPSSPDPSQMQKPSSLLDFPPFQGAPSSLNSHFVRTSSLLDFPSHFEDDNILDIQSQVLYGQKKKKESSMDLQSELLGLTPLPPPEGPDLAKQEEPRRSNTTLPSESLKGAGKDFRKSKALTRQSRSFGTTKGKSTHLFQKKKKGKGVFIGKEEASGWKEALEDLKVLRKIADKFYQKVDLHFRMHFRGFSDHCREFHSAFTSYILPNLTLNSKRKMHFVTKYLITITDLLDIERGSPLRPGASGVDKFERVEDIDLKWVVKAEVVWKSSQWVKVLFKTAQELKETLVESEVEAFKELINEYLQYLRGTKEPLKRQILEKICFFLLEHLSTHSLDPCNLFVGLIPSEMAIERLFLPFQKTDRRQSRAGTLDGLFEKGWQQNRRRVRERATEEAQADETKRKELDNTVDEQHDLQQGKTEKIQEQEPGLEKDRQEPKEDRGQEEEQEQVRKNEQEKKQEKQKQKYEQDQEQVQVQEQEQEEEQKKSKKAKKVKKVSPRKSKHRRQQPPEQVPPPLDYKDFIHALTRWSSIRQSPNQVVQEVDSLLSLLSPSITCQTGCYVAVNVSSLPKNREWFWNEEIDCEGACKYVLFRLSEPLLPSDTVAQIFIDSLETKRASIPVEELLYYHKEDQTVSLEEEKKYKSDFFRPPLFTYFQQIQELMKENVVNFIKENEAMHDMSFSDKLNYEKIEELSRDRMNMENILDSPTLIREFLIPSLVERTMRKSEDWISKVPPMLFPPPRLEDTFEEIINFIDCVPSVIENVLQTHLSLILSKISTIKKRGLDLKSGKLKNEMCCWWLDHIGMRVDKFLAYHGFEHDSLPNDYLNTPPSDMTNVHVNHVLLGEIIEEEGKKEGKYGVEKLVEEVVGEVYEKVDSLMEEMEFMLEKKWAGLPLEIGWGGEEEGEDERGQDEREVMKGDHKYLVKMKEMDEKIAEAKREGKMEKKKLELSDVVPVAGLVMARFHVKNCELNTAIQHWKKMEEMAWRKFREGEDEMERKKREEELGLGKGGAVGFLEFNESEESERWKEVWEGANTPRGERNQGEKKEGNILPSSLK